MIRMKMIHLQLILSLGIFRSVNKFFLFHCAYISSQWIWWMLISCVYVFIIISRVLYQTMVVNYDRCEMYLVPGMSFFLCLVDWIVIEWNHLATSETLSLNWCYTISFYEEFVFLLQRCCPVIQCSLTVCCDKTVVWYATLCAKTDKVTR